MEAQRKIMVKVGLMGMAFTAAVIIGCNQTDPQSEPSEASVTSTESLRLVVKSSDSCLALAEDLKALFSSLPDSSIDESLADLHKTFMETCVEKVTHDSAFPGMGELLHPPKLHRDSGAHCGWSLAKIDMLDSSMTVKYSKVCGEKMGGHATKWMDKIHDLKDTLEARGNHDFLDSLEARFGQEFLDSLKDQLGHEFLDSLEHKVGHEFLDSLKLRCEQGRPDLDSLIGTIHEHADHSGKKHEKDTVAVD